jgi:hypothetical protein
MQHLQQSFRWIHELYDELRLPGVTEGLFMNRPSLQQRGRSIIGSKDGKVLVVHCSLEIKDVLLEADPDVYFQTDHYVGYPAVLMRPEKIDKDLLRIRIVEAWKLNATKAQLAAYGRQDRPTNS